MLGPFPSCLLADGDDTRHVTAAAMVRSAALLCHRRNHCTLVEAARLVVETGWEVAIVNDAEARSITSRTVFRVLLQSEMGDESHVVVGTGPARL